ncbi:serine acetyltransferase [Marinilabiliaceae bacterium JC017]|nr:serine acetyltransferase [Marinilabiliaceae bacterium JC017]
MTNQHFPEIIQKAIGELSREQSYNSVCHKHYLDHYMPSARNLSEVVDLIREILFPGYFGGSSARPESIQYYIGVNTEKLYELLSMEIMAGLCFSCDSPEKMDLENQKEKARSMAASFVSQLPVIRQVLVTDVEAAFLGDPAAQSRGEVIFCYPAIRAITNYRIAHSLLELGVPLIPRIISEMAHSETGIDIHPRAKIGDYFTIDHGTGVVVGATSIIGNNVKLYQGVTLGAKSFPLDDDGNPIKGIDRHPILEDNVIIYAQATILGRVTIGANTVIGGNVWVTGDVPAGSKLVQFKPREVLYSDGGGI